MKLPEGIQEVRCKVRELHDNMQYLTLKCINGYNRHKALDWEIGNNLSCQTNKKKKTITWYWNQKPVITLLQPLLEKKKGQKVVYGPETNALMRYIIHHKPCVECQNLIL